MHKCWKVESISRNGSLNTPITVTQGVAGKCSGIYGLTGEREVQKTCFNFPFRVSLSYGDPRFIQSLQNTDLWHLKVAPFVLQLVIRE
ncbi:hypothetical protein CEXT_463121 [Caerostris extrusa]|uniref:Uncharacterized protein n=1 Tax=Caerostris extrusa TaxID=172846 RepID=A0AAV4NVS0_CAEEX|nr:hypothetical protein CEXT_463121 [Caerostris extrusa]